MDNFKASFSLGKLKVVKRIKTPYSNGINSICLLKDKRLVSGSGDGLIIIYNHSHKPQIKIKNAHDGRIFSLCELRNGHLASSSYKKIKIWRIGKNNYKLIHTLKQHTDCVSKVIELEDGRIASCSVERIIIWDNYTYQSITTISTGHNLITSIIEMNHSIISVAADKDEALIRWNKLTYECIQTIQNVSCCFQNALEKLNNHTLIIGSKNVLFVVDIESSEVKKLKNDTFRYAEIEKLFA